MELALVSVSLVLSLVACGVTLALFLNREDISDVRSQQRTTTLELADIADRLATWQRRDASRARKVAGTTPDDGGGLFADQHLNGGVPAGTGKAGLRVVARQRGLIR